MNEYQKKVEEELADRYKNKPKKKLVSNDELKEMHKKKYRGEMNGI